ncbi:MAG: hypothetical protein ACPGWS_10115 [Solirubrobacterales bacterium]
MSDFYVDVRVSASALDAVNAAHRRITGRDAEIANQIQDSRLWVTFELTAGDEVLESVRLPMHFRIDPRMHDVFTLDSKRLGRAAFSVIDLNPMSGELHAAAAWDEPHIGRQWRDHLDTTVRQFAEGNQPRSTVSRRRGGRR